MQVSSGTSDPAKKSRAKLPKDTLTATPAPKKPRASRKKVTVQPVAIEEKVVTPVVMEDLSDMIAVAAYYIAAQRNFAPGRELDDWLVAEQTVKSQLAA
jgi:hypothetical protein